MGQDDVSNVSNYIMFEDTYGQCVNKLDPVLNKLNSMSSADKNTFWTSNEYVISTARERLIAWALHEGKTLSLIVIYLVQIQTKTPFYCQILIKVIHNVY